MRARTEQPTRTLRRTCAWLVAVTCCFAFPRFARADVGDRVRIEATGEAAEGDASARTQAIDDAFARALDQLLTDELSRAERRRYAKPIRDRIIRHARLYVVAFAVEDESSIEGRIRVRVSAQIDRAKVLDVLDEIGIRAQAQQPSSRSRHPVVLLLHATLGKRASATFGDGGGDGGVAGRQFATELREQGFSLLDATGTSAPVSRDASSGLPVDDSGAAALARSLGAGGAFVVGIALVGEGPIRGTRLAGAEVSARVRVVTESGKAIARAEVRGAGFGEDAADATAAAAREAVERAVGEVLPAASRFWPAPRVSDDATVVEIRDVNHWAAVEAVIAQLASARGVSSVGIRRVRRGEVDLALDTSRPIRELVALVGAARFEGGSIAASGRGDRVVEARVQAALDTE